MLDHTEHSCSKVPGERVSHKRMGFVVLFGFYPHMEYTLFTAVISYLWHFTVDSEHWDSPFGNAKVITNGHDNVYNEDYHAVHHEYENVHWTQAPAQFEADREKYIQANVSFGSFEEKRLSCFR